MKNYFFPFCLATRWLIFFLFILGGGSIIILSLFSSPHNKKTLLIAIKRELSQRQDWRINLSIEERCSIRDRIKEAYKSSCNSYEELLAIASSLQEEMLHMASGNRLEYFKFGFEFDTRVQHKRKMLNLVDAPQQLQTQTEENGHSDKEHSEKPHRLLALPMDELIDVERAAAALISREHSAKRRKSPP